MLSIGRGNVAFPISRIGNSTARRFTLGLSTQLVYILINKYVLVKLRVGDHSLFSLVV
jgi:hypothetical protein